MKFCKEIYPKIALIKAAYNFTDRAYVHLDSDEEYFYVVIEPKDPTQIISEKEFINEMLTQCVRHEVFQQTKNIRELLLARAMATSVIANDEFDEVEKNESNEFTENDILKDWFDNE